jgi:hypothetical protein
MGSVSSKLLEGKIYFEQRLSDQTRHLKRVLSKSNSMESLDKAEIEYIKHDIGKIAATLDVINRAIEDEHVPSF